MSATDFFIISPKSGANFLNTSGPVGLCGADQSPRERSLAKGAKSSAGPAALAAEIASESIASISFSSTLVRVTPPAAIDAPMETKARTVTLRS